MAEEVDIYSVGVCNASVCCPKDMPIEDVAAEVNRQHPTGLDHGWFSSTEPEFKTGYEHPCPCDRDPENRTHRLFHC